MKRLFYILILMMAMLLTGCGQAPEVGAEPDTASGGEIAYVSAGGSVVQEELPEMGELYLETRHDPGNEYMAAWCLVNGARNDGTADGDVDQSASFNAEIKLRGNSTKEVEKKAYTIKFEEELSLLGMTPGRKWALVSNPFDKSLLRPAVGFTYAQALGIEYTPDFRLCKVWLNDDYMGIYTVMEPIEAGEGRVEIDVADGDDAVTSGEESGVSDFLLERNLARYEDDKVYIDSSLGMRFEFNEPEEPDEMQMQQCGEMLAAAEEAICSGEHEQYEKKIDVDSFVNFYIFHELIKDIDFGEYSTRYYFEDGILHAGPPWDLDLTMGNVSEDKEEFKYASYNNVDGAGDFVYQVLRGTETEDTDIGYSAQGLWAASGDYYYWLCRDPWFMELVQQRWQAVREITENLAVDNALGENLIDRYLTAYEADLCGNFHEGSFVENIDTAGKTGSTGGIEADASWTADQPTHISEWQKPAVDYAGNVKMMRMWLIKRISYLDSQFGPFVYTPALAVQ